MEDDRVGDFDDIERRARAADDSFCFVFARHFQWDPDTVYGLAWDTIDAFQDEFSRERDDGLAEPEDGVTMFQPEPENPDAAFRARQRVIARIVAERKAMEN